MSEETYPSRRVSFRAVADELRARIHSGLLRPGERMPTQARLAEEFGVERGMVRQALRVLADEGLLIDVARGAPARVAAAPGSAQPQPTMVSLAPRLMEAFAAPQVTVDALCLTAESLTLAFGESLRQIHAGRIKPEAVTIRVLLPSRDIDLAFPAPVGYAADGGTTHARWLDQRNAQGMVLRHNVLALRSSHGIDAEVTFRALPFTPPVKLYILNGSEALFAYYMVTRREERIGSATVDLYDALGSRSLLFPFASGATARDAVFVEQSQLHFDALWNTITTDLTLS